MRVIVAPDSYKGSATAVQVALAMQEGILAVFPQAEVSMIPIADGGEGTVEALVVATGGSFQETLVTGPLGEGLVARWGILGDGCTGVIEMAAASGLPLVPREKTNPLCTTTKGTGELVRALLDKGLTRLILGIGGSATNDGGMGFARALGVRFLDVHGRDLPEGGGSLRDLRHIDLAGMDHRLSALSITVACDVDNPLCGPLGASAVFGPQKGADQDMVATLDKGLARFAEVAGKATGRDIARHPGAGAAGGLGAGLLYFTGAKLIPGIDVVLEATDFDTIAAKADYVFTGEGHTDYQTAYGKAPMGVARRAKAYGLLVICLSGGLGQGYESLYRNGIDVCLPCPPGPMSLEACMANAPALIAEATARACRLLQLGMMRSRVYNTKKPEP